MGSDSKLVHIRVYVSGIFPAKVQQVWEVVRNYGQAETWLTGAQGVKTFTRLLPGQINNQVGSVRLVTIGQASFVDQLDALDDDRHVMKYKLISHPLNTNPFPGAFLNYRAVIKLHEVTRGPATFAEWTGEFDTEPQDCHVMRQAILERMEAGFQGLELLFPVSSRPLQHPGSARNMPGPRTSAPDPVDVARGINNMNLRATASVPLNANPHWSPRAGGAASEMAVPMQMQTRGIAESNSGSSLASSPHLNDVGGHRPGSSHTMHQWTSGGSGSTINLSTLPMRLSSDEGQVTGEVGKRMIPRRSFKEGVPEGSTYIDTSTLPQAFHSQVRERQGSQQAASFEALHKSQADAPKQRTREPVASEAPPVPPPASARQMDPLLREREEFKAAMLAQRFQHMLQKNAPEMPPSVVPAPASKSEPDWSHVAYAKDADAMSAGSSQVMTPFASVGVPGTDDDSEWARIMQQREDDRREAHFRRSRSPIPNRAQQFGHPGQLRGVPASGHAGGPFAAAAAAAGMPPPSAGIHRSTSHSSLSQQTSGGALDHSAGSTFSHPDEGQREASRQVPESAPWSST